MRWVILFLLLVTNLFGYTQISEGWFKILKGKIGKYPVTMLLHNAGHQYLGYYYYDSREQLISLRGNDTTSVDTIKLHADDELFSLLLKDKKLQGYWQKDEKTEAMSFSAAEVNAPVSFSYVAISGERKLRPSLPESPAANFTAASVWPTSTSPLDSFLKKFIIDTFFRADTEGDIRNVLSQSMESDFADYLEEGGDIFDSEIKQMASVFNRESDNDVTIAYMSPAMIVFSQFSYVYSGGAHGNYGTSYKVVDIKKKRPLELKNIITPEGERRLSQLLEQHFRLDHSLVPQDSLQEAGLFENKIAPNDNFYLTSKGIGFNYAPYEIGPYVMGEIEIFVPFTELKGYLYELAE
jgi:hypothetical protein